VLLRGYPEGRAANELIDLVPTAKLLCVMAYADLLGAEAAGCRGAVEQTLAE
jgi:hypothetical protein